MLACASAAMAQGYTGELDDPLVTYTLEANIEIDNAGYGGSTVMITPWYAVRLFIETYRKSRKLG